jgi:LAO/AO transport system kinase
VLEGDVRAVARAISRLEDGEAADGAGGALVSGIFARTGRAFLIGITGVPGGGKSTLVDQLISTIRGAGLTVGVLAVDPTSPFSGGAVLGDRVRMRRHSADRGVFVRSMATRGHLGGLAWATPQALRVLDAARCDVILIETVGVGQSEVDVAGLADTTLVLLAPGMGDGIQAAKAGILEIGDVYVVNKADRDGADQVVRDLRSVLNLGAKDGTWRPPIVKTVAQSGQGLDDLVEAIEKHRVHLDESGQLTARRERRARREIEAIAVTSLRERFGDLGGHADLETLAAEVVAGRTDPYAAADRLLAAL